MQYIIYLKPDFDFGSGSPQVLLDKASTHIGRSEILAMAENSDKAVVYEGVNAFAYDFNEGRISDRGTLVTFAYEKPYADDPVRAKILAVVKNYGIPEPFSNGQCVILYIAPFDINAIKHSRAFLITTFGHGGFRARVEDEHGNVSFPNIVGIESVRDRLFFIMQRGESGTPWKEGLFKVDASLVLDTVARDVANFIGEDYLFPAKERSWLAFYNTVLEHGAANGVELLAHYDGVYQGDVPEDDSPKPEIPEGKDTEYACRILDALRQGKRPVESCEFLFLNG